MEIVEWMVYGFGVWVYCKMWYAGGCGLGVRYGSIRGWLIPYAGVEVKKCKVKVWGLVLFGEGGYHLYLRSSLWFLDVALDGADEYISVGVCE